MKKLMILGGARYALPVIKAAHEHGIYVITADYIPNNYAHRFSDEYCNVSIVDKESTLEEARKRNIDGVISFACDPGVVTAAYIAERMGLPSVGSYEAVSILQNKGKFREFLRKHGFNVPTARSYNNIYDTLNDISLFHWPVIVKPTDSAGSKGVTRIENPIQLRKSIEYAISFSRSNEFIIEDFLQQVGYSSDADAFSIDGELKFISFNCQRFDRKADNPYTPSAYSWPASITAEHQAELKDEIQRLINLLGLGTSIYNIETRECVDGKTYIMECSPRGGGNRLSEMIKYSTGVDLIEAAVLSAIGIPINNVEQVSSDDCWAEIILHSDKAGVFDKVIISDEIIGNVIERDVWVNRGEHIGGFSAANEAIGTIILKFDSQGKMERYMGRIDELIRVEVL